MSKKKKKSEIRIIDASRFMALCLIPIFGDKVGVPPHVIKHALTKILANVDLTEIIQFSSEPVKRKKKGKPCKNQHR